MTLAPLVLKGRVIVGKSGGEYGWRGSVVSQQMPATGPGSLANDDYVQIMAYLLQQNGYPAGAKPLDYDEAAASNVALLYRGK